MASRERLTAMLPRTLIGFGKCCARGQKAGKLFGFRQTPSPLLQTKERKNSSKMNERSGNVYENKGSAFKTRQRSGNVIENKGSYA